jgi:hypothetical protein
MRFTSFVIFSLLILFSFVIAFISPDSDLGGAPIKFPCGGCSLRIDYASSEYALCGCGKYYHIPSDSDEDVHGAYFDGSSFVFLFFQNY